MRRPLRLEAESANGRNEGGVLVTHEDAEERKNGISYHSNLQIIDRSDAFHAA